MSVYTKDLIKLAEQVVSSYMSVKINPKRNEYNEKKIYEEIDKIYPKGNYLTSEYSNGMNRGIEKDDFKLINLIRNIICSYEEMINYQESFVDDVSYLVEFLEKTKRE